MLDLLLVQSKNCLLFFLGELILVLVSTELFLDYVLVVNVKGEGEVIYVVEEMRILVVLFVYTVLVCLNVVLDGFAYIVGHFSCDHLKLKSVAYVVSTDTVTER